MLYCQCLFFTYAFDVTEVKMFIHHWGRASLHSWGEDSMDFLVETAEEFLQGSLL